jgi:hypothetical protein
MRGFQIFGGWFNVCISNSDSITRNVDHSCDPDFEADVCRMVNAARNGLFISQLSGDVMGCFRDRDKVLAAVSRYGCALKFATMYHNDHEIAKAAVSNDPSAIRFAGEDADDKLRCSLIDVAFKKDQSSIYHLSKSEVKYCLSKDGLALKHVGSAFQNDIDIVFCAIRNNPKSLQFAGRDAVLEVVSNNGLYLEHVGFMWKDDIDIYLTAINQNERACRFAIGPVVDDQRIKDLIREKRTSKSYSIFNITGVFGYGSSAPVIPRPEIGV